MDSNLQEIADQLIQYANNEGVEYCDVRAEIQTGKSILIENGEIEHLKNQSEQGLGIRILENGSWGFCSFDNPNSFEEIKESMRKTIKNTNYYSQNKNNKSKIKVN